jgi:molybdopterin-containing oxidoreductase family membrane subunit
VWKAIILGPYWYVFWVGQVGMAMVLPIIIYLVKRDSPFFLATAGLITVVGIVSVRFNLVIPAFVTPPIPGLENVYHNERLLFEYFPSPIEWVSSIGMISLIVFLFALAYRILPVQPILETEVQS